MHKQQGIYNLARICEEKNLRHFVISPGSRNAPIIMSLLHQKQLQCYSITDERSAAYFAIGLAQQLDEPVGLACTSGTAALNYYPGIAEAFYQQIPLVILTADRPPEWIDQADGQTIRQTNLFEKHVKKSYQLPVSINERDDLWFNDRIISEAINLAVSPNKGPVHINIPLREPLYETYYGDTVNTKIINTYPSQIHIKEENLLDLVKSWNDSPKKMILCGFGQPSHKLFSIMNKLSDDPSVVIIAENISNNRDLKTVACLDRFFASTSEQNKNQFIPDLIVSFGGMVVSKQLKLFLRQHKPKRHWHLSEGNLYPDTYQSLTDAIPVNTTDFFEFLLTHKKTYNAATYKKNWYIQERKANHNHESLIKQLPFCDLSIFSTLLGNIPKNSILHLANSTVIRYAQLFNSRSDVSYFSNRGTSGIDGVVSTAVGTAAATDKIVTCITGDLAFLYDSNALWNNYIKENLKIIVLNNNGGDIFRFIQDPDKVKGIQNYFTTPQKVQLKNLAKAYNLDYLYINEKSDVLAALKEFYNVKTKISILEIDTREIDNIKYLKHYFTALQTSP